MRSCNSALYLWLFIIIRGNSSKSSYTSCKRCLSFVGVSNNFITDLQKTPSLGISLCIGSNIDSIVRRGDTGRQRNISADNFLSQVIDSDILINIFSKIYRTTLIFLRNVILLQKIRQKRIFSNSKLWRLVTYYLVCFYSC